MDVSGLIGIIGGLFGLLSLVAGSAVYLRASYAKARIEALNAEIQEEQRRNASLRVDLTASNAKIAVLEAKIDALNELVMQRAQLEVLSSALDLISKEQTIMMVVVNQIAERVNP